MDRSCHPPPFRVGLHSRVSGVAVDPGRTGAAISLADRPASRYSFVPMDTAIAAEHLSKTFRVGFWARKVRAVRDLSLEVRRGEIFGLLGPNGAGKTTTIKMLLGFVRPTSGRAIVGGFPAGSLASRRRLGYLPENPALYEYLNGLEYLRFVG